MEAGVQLEAESWLGKVEAGVELEAEGRSGSLEAGVKQAVAVQCGVEAERRREACPSGERRYVQMRRRERD